MPSKTKTPAAVGAASGGGPEALGIEYRSRWLDQVLEDPGVSATDFRVAFGLSAVLMRDAGHPLTSLAVIAAAMGKSAPNDSPAEVRQPLDRLEARGHLRITRRLGRGNWNLYTLLFNEPPALQSPPLDLEPRVSLERLPALLAALRDVVRAARAAGLNFD